MLPSPSFIVHHSLTFCHSTYEVEKTALNKQSKILEYFEWIGFSWFSVGPGGQFIWWWWYHMFRLHNNGESHEQLKNYWLFREVLNCWVWLYCFRFWQTSGSGPTEIGEQVAYAASHEEQHPILCSSQCGYAPLPSQNIGQISSTGE